MGIMVRKFLNDIPLFVEIARYKSFSKASETLDIGLSTLSRRIKLLEKDMGVRLFYRDTRNVELTPGGAVLLEQCEYILEEAKNAYESAMHNMHSPSGGIRVCVFADAYNALFGEALSVFVSKWPEIQLTVSYSETPVDIRKDPYDVVFSVSPFADPSLVARKIFTIDIFLYASPTLFEKFPVPACPQDLLGLPCIILERFGNQWPLRDGSREVTLSVRQRHRFSSVELCHEFVRAGHGVAFLRQGLAARDEKSGRLVRLLPDWRGPEHYLYMITGPKELSRRVRLFVDHMKEHFAHVSKDAGAV